MRKFFLSLSFLLTGYLSYSQINFGVKSGINIATTRDFIEFPKNRVGWYAGGSAKTLLKKRYFLQTELLFSTKGNGVDQLNPIGAPNGVFRFNYLNFPIFLGYKIDHKTSVVFGAEFGYLISAQIFYQSVGTTIISKNIPSKFDAGIDIGLEYNIIKNFGIEVRYNYGLRTFYETDAIGNRTVQTKGANRVFQIGVNYAFYK